MISALKKLFSSKKASKEELINAGVCPNCWGKQEYDGMYQEKAKDRQIDINNHSSQATQAFVQNFITEHVDGIRLKDENNRLVCTK